MKIFISADIEGTTGITTWDEGNKNNSVYNEFRDQMTEEVAAACRGALKAGATEIVVKDAHATGRNIIHSRLPKEAKLIRGWSGHPYCMMTGIDSSFDAVLMTGYHSAAYSNNNPLAHTINSSVISYIKINDLFASEFYINSLTAGSLNVPVVFLSGDQGICDCAHGLIPEIDTYVSTVGIGESTLSNHPACAVDSIEKIVYLALKKENYSSNMVKLPVKYSVELSFKEHANAYKASFYTGVEQIDDKTIIFKTEKYFEFLKLLAFVL
jgi:D-amino peptidase